MVAVQLRWDPYPFILLNLAFSTQAAYAAPLILLAQNRQDDRDRAQAERDRGRDARTQADTEYLARELASVRLALADVVTADDLRDAVEQVDLGPRRPARDGSTASTEPDRPAFEADREAELACTRPPHLLVDAVRRRSSVRLVVAGPAHGPPR